MDSRISKIAGIFIPALIILFATSLFSGNTQNLSETIKNLKIGLNGYFIGNKLSKAQIDILQKNKIKKSYKNTIKFKDKDIYVTVSKDFTILGIYNRIENGTFEDFKKTISFLMVKFGEPTIEAHDNTIYWFYSDKGKITSNDFLEQKSRNKITKPLVMVKFYSKKSFSVINDKKDTTTFYYIIYSEPLINKFNWYSFYFLLN